MKDQKILLKNNHPRPDKLILHCGYHKVATSFFGPILRQIAKAFNWNYQVSFQQPKLNPATDIFLNNKSINFGDLERPYVGSHIIRDPRDLIISGYFYHLWCDEKWVKKKSHEYKGLNYQEALNSISQEEGIAMEIGRVKWVVKRMVSWDYSNPHILEVRLEELAVDEQDVFRRIFEKYEFNREQIEIGMSIVEKLSFEKRTGRKKGEEDRKSHLRKGVAGDWKNHFTEEHKKLFKVMYPGVLAQLGYEHDDNW